MALSNSQYNAIMRMYDRRQIENKHDQDARIRRVYEAVPALAEVQEELTASFAACAKCRLSGDETGAAVWRAKIEDLKEQRRVLLKSGGFSEDYINMRYQCPDCRDTGYRDGKKCHCFKQAEIELLYSQSGIHEKLNSENFEHFSLEYFDNTQVEPKSGKTAYEYMRQTVDFCWDYIERFGEEKGNILFTGKAGRGKTFLSSCIAKELMDRRFSVVYLRWTCLIFFPSINSTTTHRRKCRR
jgi:DNA replication protein DnaC